MAVYCTGNVLSISCCIPSQLPMNCTFFLVISVIWSVQWLQRLWCSLDGTAVASVSPQFIRKRFAFKFASLWQIKCHTELRVVRICSRQLVNAYLWNLLSCVLEIKCLLRCTFYHRSLSVKFHGVNRWFWQIYSCLRCSYYVNNNNNSNNYSNVLKFVLPRRYSKNTCYAHMFCVTLLFYVWFDQCCVDCFNS